MTAAAIATLRLSGGILALSRHALLPACDQVFCAVESLALLCCCVHCRQIQGVVPEERAEKTLREARVVIALYVDNQCILGVFCPGLGFLDVCDER